MLNVVPYVLIKNENLNICGTGGQMVKVKPTTLLTSFNNLETSYTSSVLRSNKILSSAYFASLIRFILPFIDIDKPLSFCFICSAKTYVAIINNKADIGQPCRIPLDSKISTDSQ